jgi:recombination protein RecA
MIGQGRENSKMYLKDNPALMAEVEEQVKGILGMNERPADTEVLDD